MAFQLYNQSSHAAASFQPIRTSVLLSLVLGLGLGRRQVHVSPWPEAAKVANREAQRETHLASHDDEAHVPAKHSDDKEQSTASLTNGRLLAKS